MVSGKSGSWEIRESRATAQGPRSRTLATFRELTPDIVERARARACKPLEPRDLHKAAIRAGAPVAAPTPDRAARALLAELAAGHLPRRALAGLLHDLLAAPASPSSDAARSVLPWVDASPAQRGEALRDLLALSDQLPAKRRGAALCFPGLRKAAA